MWAALDSSVGVKRLATFGYHANPPVLKARNSSLPTGVTRSDDPEKGGWQGPVETQNSSHNPCSDLIISG